MAASILCRASLGLLVVSSRAQAKPAGGPYGGTAATIPGLIEAEEFDYGGEGVGYSDSTPNNIQGAFRPDEAVDIHALNGGGYNIGYITLGEYLRYTVDVTENVEAFNFKFVVSSDRYTGSFRIVTGGTGCDDFTTNLSGTVTVPYTGGWQEYVDFTVSGEGDGGLAIGAAYIWLCPLSETFNIDSFTMDITSSAYGGIRAIIPGLIEAEEFDIGGQGLAYYDTSKTNKGNAFRTDERVDVGSTDDGGYYVGWTRAGEYLHYTVNVQADVDAFNFSFLVAPSKKDPGSFRVVTGGTGCEDFTTDLSGLVSVPGDAGSPFDYVKIYNAVSGGLSTGTAVIRLCVVTEGFEIDSFSMTAYTGQ